MDVGRIATANNQAFYAAMKQQGQQRMQQQNAKYNQLRQEIIHQSHTLVGGPPDLSRPGMPRVNLILR